MSWEAIAAIGEICGALGVIATLVYLAGQIRDNSRSVKASTYQEIYRDMERRLTTLPLETREKERRGEALTPEEQSTLDQWTLITMRAYENWWQQRRYGILDDNIFEAYASHMKITLGTERSRMLWDSRGVAFLPGFVEYVDAHIKSHPIAKDK